jgi:glutathione S-transferase
MPRLYDLELSGNCYKVRLLCALLDVPVEIVPVDFMAGEHKRSPLIDKNPFGEIPIFEDDGVTLRDSQAILIYIAGKWGDEA